MINSIWLDEINRMNRLLHDTMESSIQQVLRQIERQHRQLLEPPSYHLLRELEDRHTTTLQKLSEKVTPDLLSIDHTIRELENRNAAAAARRFSEALTADFSSIIGQFKTLKVLAAVPFPENVAADLQRAFQAFQTPALPALESYADQLRSITRNLDAMRQFQDTFAGQLLEIARDLAEAPEAELEERTEDLAELLETHLATSRGGPVSLEGYIQIILALMLYVHSVIGAQQTEDRVMKHLSTITAQLQEIATAGRSTSVPELRLVAATSLRIRSEPSGESEIIGKLTRNSLVRVISREKSWARVEYFDFVHGRTAEGWVAHRFLRKLPDEFWQDAPAQRTDAEMQAARERFERHFGEVDLGYATGADNEQIDADLAREYAGTDQPN